MYFIELGLGLTESKLMQVQSLTRYMCVVCLCVLRDVSCGVCLRVV